MIKATCEYIFDDTENAKKQKDQIAICKKTFTKYICGNDTASLDNKQKAIKKLVNELREAIESNDDYANGKKLIGKWITTFSNLSERLSGKRPALTYAIKKFNSLRSGMGGEVVCPQFMPPRCGDGMEIQGQGNDTNGCQRPGKCVMR